MYDNKEKKEEREKKTENQIYKGNKIMIIIINGINAMEIRTR